MSDTPAVGCMRMVLQALLRGDVAARDRLVARAELLDAAERKAGAVARVLAVDFYVTAAGTSIPTRVMAKAAGAIH